MTDFTVPAAVNAGVAKPSPPRTAAQRPAASAAARPERISTERTERPGRRRSLQAPQQPRKAAPGELLAPKAKPSAPARATATRAAEAAAAPDPQIVVSPHLLETFTAAIAKAALDYRSFLIEIMRSNVTASLDLGSGLARIGVSGVDAIVATATPAQVDAAKLSRRGKGAAQKSAARRSIDDPADLAAAALDLALANLNLSLDYARRLAGAETPSEVLALTMTQVRRLFELVTQQAAELRALSLALVAANAERTSERFGRLFSRA